jgi:hypothetical protein
MNLTEDYETNQLISEIVQREKEETKGALYT